MNYLLLSNTIFAHLADTLDLPPVLLSDLLMASAIFCMLLFLHSMSESKGIRYEG